MIKNLFLPGLGTCRTLYSGFLKQLPGLEFIPNPACNFDEIDCSIRQMTGPGGKINLFGWSLGSLFALRWTLENPGQVNSLFLTGATARFCEKAGYHNGIKPKTLQLMIKLMKHNPRRVMEDFYKSALQRVPDREMYFRLIKAALPAAESFSRGLQELAETDLLDELKKINVPVKIYQGANDHITPIQGAVALSRKITGSQLIRRSGGHSLILEFPGECARIFKEWIDTGKEKNDHPSTA